MIELFLGAVILGMWSYCCFLMGRLCQMHLSEEVKG